MSAAPDTTNIPGWPSTSVVLHDDGSGVLTINGTDEPIAAADVTAARTLVLERVSAYARDDLARPVRLLATDPDGSRSELAVHPDGHVAQITVVEAPRAAAPARAAARGRGVAVPRRRAAGARMLLGVALLTGIVVAVAVFSVLGSRDAGAPAMRARPTTEAASLDRSAGAVAQPDRTHAGARAATAADSARREAARGEVAHRRAVTRAARRRAAAARRARRAHARAAARRRVSTERAAQAIAPPASPTGGSVSGARGRLQAAPVAPAAPPRPARPREPEGTPGDLPPADDF